MKLQLNTNGSWKAIVDFEPERRADVLRALHALDQAIGSSAKWSLVHEDGKREWLDMPKLEISRYHQNCPSCTCEEPGEVAPRSRI